MITLPRALFDDLGDGVGRLDDSFRYTSLNGAAGPLLGRPDSELLGLQVWESLPGLTGDDVRTLAGAATDPVSLGRYTVDDRHVEVRLYPDADGFTVLFSAGRVATDTAADRLAALIALGDPLGAVLTDASTRTGVEQDLCELLGESGLYDLAWIAAYSPGWTQLEPRGRGGPAAEFMELADLSLSEDGRLGALLSAAISTGAVQYLRDLRTDSLAAGWRDQAADHGLRNVCLVPIAYAGSIYGVLSTYTGHAHAFGPPERQLLATLGSRIGSAIHTIEAERLLLSESVVELTFQSSDEASLLVAASRELDCTIEVLSTLPAADAPVLYYAAMTDVDPATVDRWATDTAGVREHRLVEPTAGDGGVFELVLDRASLADTVVSAGAILSAARVADGRAEIVCEVAADRDLNDFAARLTERFPKTDLVAKQTRDDESTMDRRLWASGMATVFETELTDRQRQALRAAVYAGYFDTPRKSTGSEIAAALSMTQPTFSYHLRNAQRRLFTALLDQ